MFRYVYVKLRLNTGTNRLAFLATYRLDESISGIKTKKCETVVTDD